MKWLVTVSVVCVGRRTGNLYHDAYTKLVNSPDDFAGAIGELVGSAQSDDNSITGVVIVPSFETS